MGDERKPVVGVVVPASGSGYTPTREQFEAAGRRRGKRPVQPRGKRRTDFGLRFA